MASKWIDVVFLQGEEADEPLRILDEEGVEAALDYLAQWDMGDGGGEERDESPAGSDDDTYEVDGYQMNVNMHIGYIGLCRLED